MEQTISFKDMQLHKEYTSIFRIASLEEAKAKNGNPYVNLGLADAAGITQKVKLWKSEEEVRAEGYTENDLLRVTFLADEYNGRPDYKVQSMERLTMTPEYAAIFARKIEDDPEKLFESILTYIGKASRPGPEGCGSLSDLTKSLLLKNKEAFITSSAAKSVHHNLLGGLVYHTCGMVIEAYRMTAVYKTLRPDLLVCGTALHDIGKIREFATSPFGDADYTPVGNLLGHAVIGIMMIEKEVLRAAAEDGITYDPEEVMLLEHMIASHHGRPEYGAIKMPQIPEAVALHNIDDNDAKMYLFRDQYSQMDEGSTTPQRNFALEAPIYKPHGSMIPRV